MKNHLPEVLSLPLMGIVYHLLTLLGGRRDSECE